MMRKWIPVLALLLISAGAWATPARDETINTLLVETRVEQSLTATYAQIDQHLENSLIGAYEAAAKGAEPSDDQRRRVKEAASKMGQVFRQELNWASMRPIYIQIYKEALSEEEVQGMIDLYRTPAGRALVEKMPVILQKSMLVLSEKMPTLMQKMIPAIEKAVGDLQASK